jgi:hypothetical protein
LRPTLRRLKYLVRWGTLALTEQEDDAQHISILEVVVCAFSPWVQQLFLLRAKGQVRKEDSEMREVLTHLDPLYMFFQHRAVVGVTLAAADAVAEHVRDGTVDKACLNRCRTVFPTIVEAVCVVDRLNPSTDGDALASMRTRRVRLQRLVNRIRDVLDSPYAEASMQSSQSSQLSASLRTASLVELPPDGVEDEQSDHEYFSASDEEEVSTAARNANVSAELRARVIASQCHGDVQAPIQSRLKCAPGGPSDHFFWSSFDASVFDVRSASYLDDRLKTPSAPALLEVLNVDIFRSPPDGPVWQTTKNPDCYAQHHWWNGNNHFLFVQNFVFPPYQAVITAAVGPSAEWLHDEKSPNGIAWKRFLEMTPENQRRKLKLIPLLVEGPWLAKKALPKKPAIIGTKIKMETFHEPGKYLEVVFDTSSGKAEQMITTVLLRAAKGVRLALATVIEGTSVEELPEAALVCASLGNLDTSHTVYPLSK